MAQALRIESQCQQPRGNEEQPKTEDVDGVRLASPHLIAGIGPYQQRDADGLSPAQQAAAQRCQRKADGPGQNGEYRHDHHHGDRRPRHIGDAVIAEKYRVSGAVDQETQIDRVIRAQLEHQPIVHDHAIVQKYRRMGSQQQDRQHHLSAKQRHDAHAAGRRYFHSSSLFGSDKSRTEGLNFCFDMFSSREPVPASLENAIDDTTTFRARWRCGGNRVSES